MALTDEDLQAIANLFHPINNRLDKIDGRLDKIEGRLDTVENRLDQVDNRLDKLESEVSALKPGQLDIRREIKQVDKRVSDTYNIALEAWGTSTENRKWL